VSGANKLEGIFTPHTLLKSHVTRRLTHSGSDVSVETVLGGFAAAEPNVKETPAACDACSAMPPNQPGFPFIGRENVDHRFSWSNAITSLMYQEFILI
jgi:hypothetical protein